MLRAISFAGASFKKSSVIDFSIEHSQDGQQWAPFMNGRYTKKAKK